MENFESILSATEKSILSSSVSSIKIFPPDKSSSDVPLGMLTSFARIDIPFAVLLFTARPAVSL